MPQNVNVSMPLIWNVEIASSNLAVGQVLAATRYDLRFLKHTTSSLNCYAVGFVSDSSGLRVAGLRGSVLARDRQGCLSFYPLVNKTRPGKALELTVDPSPKPAAFKGKKNVSVVNRKLPT